MQASWSSESCRLHTKPDICCFLSCGPCVAFDSCDWWWWVVNVLLAYVLCARLLTDPASSPTLVCLSPVSELLVIFSYGAVRVRTFITRIEYCSVRAAFAAAYCNREQQCAFEILKLQAKRVKQNIDTEYHEIFFFHAPLLRK